MNRENLPTKSFPRRRFFVDFTFSHTRSAMKIACCRCNCIVMCTRELCARVGWHTVLKGLFLFHHKLKTSSYSHNFSLPKKRIASPRSTTSLWLSSVRRQFAVWLRIGQPLPGELLFESLYVIIWNTCCECSTTTRTFSSAGASKVVVVVVARCVVVLRAALHGTTNDLKDARDECCFPTQHHQQQHNNAHGGFAFVGVVGGMYWILPQQQQGFYRRSLVVHGEERRTREGMDGDGAVVINMEWKIEGRQARYRFHVQPYM